MRFVLLTNFPNPHQMPLFHGLQRQAGAVNVRLVFLLPVSTGREQMRWTDDGSDPGLIRYWQSPRAREETAHWIDKAEVVIQGRFPTEHVRERIRSGKLTFAYQERLWKKGFYRPSTLTRVYRLYRNYWSVNRQNYHFLAAGAYASGDVARLGCFRQRTWKFGYFTDPPNALLEQRSSSKSLRVVWCGRLIPVKRPRLAVAILRQVRDRGYPVSLTLVGDGPERNAVEGEIARHNLGDSVHITGIVEADRVAEEMKRADVLLFTSNRQDGWGMVINEAMGQGCCVVAADEAGGPPWLIEHEKSGLLFKGSNAEQAVDQLVRLVREPDYRRALGDSGRQRIQDIWSADTAARRLCLLAEGLLAGRDMRGYFHDGPCSAA